jgi:hypothetical protein
MPNKLTKIVRWDGGMKNDIRDRAFNSVRLIKNFDPITYPYRLEPYRASESGNDTPARELDNFLFSNSRLYGYGVQSGTSKTALFFKASNDFGDDSWETPSNNESGNFTRETELFVFYSYGGAGYIFGGQTDRIWKFAVNGSAFTDADLSVTHTSISQGLVHPKDNILYVPYDNIIAKNAAGSWTAAAITLPAEYLTRGLCTYGNYLAIPVKPLPTGSGKTSSYVYLWDRDSSVTTLSESIDFGAGNLEILEELNGELIGIMELGNRLVIKRVRSAQDVETIVDFSFDSTITLRQRKQKKNDRIYFMMTATLDGVTHYGVWAIGKNKLGQWCLYLDRTPNNDTDPNSIQGFFLVDASGLEYMFQAYTDGSSAKQVSKTNESAIHTATAVAETVKYNSDSPGDEKKLEGVTVAHAALPANGQVVLKCKIDEETSFTTIFTHTTEDSMTHSAVGFESSGATLPEHNEVQFRIEVSTTSGLDGPVRILELDFLTTPVDKNTYGR